MGEAMVRVLNDVVNGAIISRERVEATARAYVAGLRAHMRTEESEILPRAARLVSESDWTEIDAAIANFDDPVFGSQVHGRYARLREQINPAGASGQGDGALARWRELNDRHDMHDGKRGNVLR